MGTYPDPDWTEDVTGDVMIGLDHPANVRVVEPVRILDQPPTTISSTAGVIAASAAGVQATPIRVAPAHPARAKLRVKNTHAAQHLFVGPSTMTNTTGYDLAPGESIDINSRAEVWVCAADQQPAAYSTLSQFRDG